MTDETESRPDTGEAEAEEAGLLDGQEPATPNATSDKGPRGWDAISNPHERYPKPTASLQEQAEAAANDIYERIDKLVTGILKHYRNEAGIKEYREGSSLVLNRIIADILKHIRPEAKLAATRKSGHGAENERLRAALQKIADLKNAIQIRGGLYDIGVPGHLRDEGGWVPIPPGVIHGFSAAASIASAALAPPGPDADADTDTEAKPGTTDAEMRVAAENLGDYANLVDALTPFALYAKGMTGLHDLLTIVVSRGSQSLAIGAFQTARQTLIDLGALVEPDAETEAKGG